MVLWRASEDILMEQFIAYENRGGGKNVYPWLVNLQHPVVDV
jgi:toxin CcdB